MRFFLFLCAVGVISQAAVAGDHAYYGSSILYAQGTHAPYGIEVRTQQDVVDRFIPLSFKPSELCVDGGDMLYILSAEDQSLTLVHLGTCTVFKKFKTNAMPSDLVYHRDRIYFFEDHQKVVVFDCSKIKYLTTLDLNSHCLEMIFSDTKLYLTRCLYEHPILVYDLASLTRTYEVPVPSSGVNKVILSDSKLWVLTKGNSSKGMVASLCCLDEEEGELKVRISSLPHVAQLVPLDAQLGFTFSTASQTSGSETCRVVVFRNIGYVFFTDMGFLKVSAYDLESTHLIGTLGLPVQQGYFTFTDTHLYCGSLKLIPLCPTDNLLHTILQSSDLKVSYAKMCKRAFNLTGPLAEHIQLNEQESHLYGLLVQARRRAREQAFLLTTASNKDVALQVFRFLWAGKQQKANLFIRELRDLEEPTIASLDYALSSAAGKALYIMNSWVKLY